MWAVRKQPVPGRLHREYRLERESRLTSNIGFDVTIAKPRTRLFPQVPQATAEDSRLASFTPRSTIRRASHRSMPPQAKPLEATATNANRRWRRGRRGLHSLGRAKPLRPAKHQLKAGVHVTPRRGDQSAEVGFVPALGNADAPAVAEHQLNAGSAAGARRFREPAQRTFVQSPGDAQPPGRRN